MADSVDKAHYRFWPKRLPKNITPPQTALWDNLATSARRYPGKTAINFFGRQTHYAQLMAHAEAFAAYLQGLGVRRMPVLSWCWNGPG